jgi:hypothetical protein
MRSLDQIGKMIEVLRTKLSDERKRVAALEYIRESCQWCGPVELAPIIEAMHHSVKAESAITKIRDQIATAAAEAEAKKWEPPIRKQVFVVVEDVPYERVDYIRAFYTRDAAQRFIDRMTAHQAAAPEITNHMGDQVNLSQARMRYAYFRQFTEYPNLRSDMMFQIEEVDLEESPDA